MFEFEERKEVALDEVVSKMLLKQYSIPVVEEELTTSVSAAVSAAENFGYPVVLKGVVPTVTHKSDIGAVITNVRDSNTLQAAYTDIISRVGSDLIGIVVQPHIEGKREFYAGLVRDHNFGPVIMFGLGGVMAEVIHDIRYRLAPVSDSDIEEMIDELDRVDLFGEFRGEKSIDRKQIAKVLKGLSKLAKERDDIAEVDINPLKVTADGEVLAVDSLIIVEKTERPHTGRRFDIEHLKKLLSPDSVVFIGASATFSKWGYRVASNTIAGGFEKDIYLVNANEDEILGHQSYKSVSSIPEEITIDLAVVTIPAAKVLPLLPELKARGVKGMLLISSGFRETGEEGQRLEEELVYAACQADIMIIGPNTKGISNPHHNFFCNSTHLHSKPGGNVIISQSGNLGAQLIHYGHVHGIGLRLFIGSGNEAMVTIEDYMEFLLDDHLTQTVLLYIESVKDGRRFYETGRRLSLKKPVVVLKGGCSHTGNIAAASHSGALATDMHVFNALCKQAGLVQVETTTELLDLSTVFSSLPLPQGNRVAIVTFGGGWGVVTADQCEHQNLTLEPLPLEMMDQFDAFLPDYWSRANPVDIVGEVDPKIPMKVVEALMDWNGCDAVIHLGIQGRAMIVEQITASMNQLKDRNYPSTHLKQVMRDSIREEAIYVEFLAEVTKKYNKPIIGVGLMTDSRYHRVSNVLGYNHKVVLLPTPDRAVKALAGMVRYGKWLSSTIDHEI